MLVACCGHAPVWFAVFGPLISFGSVCGSLRSVCFVGAAALCLAVG
jgi:hypothetical protein